ncbi:hypothetical protein [Phreatobacter oligotrophus]|jgi:hypothetical protein|uniref:hypothetical protein n=1 Tax=Phreatobacter oligotrophus TaxID=1122261 RepID=UPI002354785F|nr:hypothetical protein [Phreatobacter oligotrophus]MBX9988989.1 hypothetical protein [Phreatobacter oligotrophus]
MMSRSPRASLKALGGMATGLMLSACAGNYATQGPITVESNLPATYVASCIENLFNTRLPLVRRSPLIGGTLIKVMDLNDHTIAAASVLTEDGRTRVSFVSDHADRYWYEDLFRRCVAVPNGWR